MSIYQLISKLWRTSHYYSMSPKQQYLLVVCPSPYILDISISNIYTFLCLIIIRLLKRSTQKDRVFTTLLSPFAHFVSLHECKTNVKSMNCINAKEWMLFSLNAEMKMKSRDHQVQISFMFLFLAQKQNAETIFTETRAFSASLP